MARRQRDREAADELEQSLADFHRAAWRWIDPAEYVHNWHIDAMAEHLMAVNAGEVRNLIITLPPRCMKSLMVSVTWPAWTWAQSEYGALSGAHVKFINISYDPKLSIRDAIKMRRLINSPWYLDRWGNRVELMDDKNQTAMFENSAGGFRFSTSVHGGLTGEGGDILAIDDCLNAKKAMWESARNDVNTWWDEALPTRLNDQRTGAKVIIMQRLHENDLVGHVLDKDEQWVHLKLPMEFDPSYDTRTWVNGHVFFQDPRTEVGELLWEERFPRDAVERLKTELGPFAASAQLAQSPTPKAGGIIDRMWWQNWPAPGYETREGGPLTYPPMSFIMGSVDTAYGEKDEDAWNAMTVWGIWYDKRERPKVMLMEAWRKRVPLRGVIPEECTTEEERKPHWGLAEFVADTARRRKIDVVLIENKTRGKDLADEVMRILRKGEARVLLDDPVGDKVARLHAVQAIFADAMVYAPNKAWADTVITEVSQFPRSKWKDYTDTCSSALSWMRRSGLLPFGVDADQENVERDTFRPRENAPLYDV